MAKISIVVPTRQIDFYVERCLRGIATMLKATKTIDPEAVEILIVTDKICPGLPSAKRNWAMERATGDIFAFIDSDAYPSPDWLKNALYWLQCYPAVCGPGVLPPDAPFSEQVADQVHKWVFCPYRVTPQAPRLVPWFPTFNLVVRREVASKFDPYLTGEDDRFGLKIPGGIFYHPDILVYHNRRGAFRPLWRQFGQWGKTKGHFFRLAAIAWITTLFTYATNYVYGFFKRKI